MESKLPVDTTSVKEELNKSLLLVPNLIDIVYQYVGNPFIIALEITDKNKYKITIPYIRSEAGAIIDWGDGKSEDFFEKKDITHFYNNSGIYHVNIFCGIAKISFRDVGELVEISQWGDLILCDGFRTFENCRYLNISALDKPNLKFATNLSRMFYKCNQLNANLNIWDVRNVTDMSHMFDGCIKFNGNISIWDVSNVINMSHMFDGCIKFNGNISNWDVSNVTNMSCMFNGCSKFNDNLSNWDVSNVTDMSCMFNNCSKFNDNLSNWNVSNVTDMSNMFSGCSKFNDNLSNWDIRNVTDISWMFDDCTQFNPDLSGWNVGNVSNIE